MTIQCRNCQRVYSVPVTEEQMKRWRSGALIQNVMPGLTTAERELLISQICGECFDRIFSEE